MMGYDHAHLTTIPKAMTVSIMKMAIWLSTGRPSYHALTLPILDVICDCL